MVRVLEAFEVLETKNKSALKLSLEPRKPNARISIRNFLSSELI